MNILDLEPDQFKFALRELAQQGVDTARLMREYERKNSPFSGVYDWADQRASAAAAAGRTPIAMGLLSKAAGTTGMDALRSVEVEPLNFIAGLLSDAASAVDAPASAARGLIPVEDIGGRALGTAGFAQLGGAGMAAPKGALRSGAMRSGVGDGNLSIFEKARLAGDKIRERFGVEPEITTHPTNWGNSAYVRVRVPGEDKKTYADLGFRLSDHEVGEFRRATDELPTIINADAVTPETLMRQIEGDYERAAQRMNALTEKRLAREASQEAADNAWGMADQKVKEAAALAYKSSNAGRTGKPWRNLSPQEKARFAYKNGSISANRSATAGAIALPAARNEAEDMARRILEMRAAGNAGDVTDAMMAQADPQYMFNNTPLPMDEASRMARAGEMGFGGDRYHGSNMDFQNFSGSAFTSDNPTVASTYNRGMQDAVIYPLMTREGVGGTVNVEGGLSNWNQLRPDMIDVPYVARELDMGMPISTRDIERQAKFEGFSGVNFNDINDLGPGFNSQQFKNIGYTPEQAEAMRVQYLTELSSPSNVDVRFYPNLSRSRFARFDPEFSHLANLNAANASPLTGLLAMQSEEDRKRAIRSLLGGF